MKRCPKCDHDTFYVTAHVTQGWLVDSEEEYLQTTIECEEVTYWPNDDDIWQCSKCGYDASGSKFNL